MPDIEGALPIILLMIFLWVRSIGSAMKKNRQRQEQALERAGAEPELEAESGFGAEPARVQATDPAGAEAARPTLREQLRDMGRQLEQQMQQAAEEGRPGSLVGHVEPEEVPATPPFLRPTAAVPPRTPSPAPAAAVPRTARTPGRRTPPPMSPIAGAQSPSAGAGRKAPLERLERYPALARAVILSEILGTPPGLTDREGPPAPRG